ncbi:MAG: flavodoxin family protein [Oscillospiraceae bacterium]|nr:flavodoxin family protein [Oscillospiraceae bacterium]
MSDILCLYYSRTGKTREVMQDMAQALDAELVEITDGIDRSGALGFFMCGIDAMRRGTHKTQPYKTERELEDYKLVVLGTPIWAGRCSSVMRGFLKRHGLELRNVAYVLTRGSEHRDEDIFDQMDLYTTRPRLAGASIRVDSVGYHFWRDQFLNELKNLCNDLPALYAMDDVAVPAEPVKKSRRRRRRRRTEDDNAG